MADIEYASNSKGNTALTLGSIALGLSGLNAINSGALGGILGGLGGHQPCMGAGVGTAAAMAVGFNESEKFAQLYSQIATLTAENYSDKGDVAIYKQALADNNALRAYMDEKFSVTQSNLNSLNNYAHEKAIELARLQEQTKCCCEKQELQQQLTEAKIHESTLVLNGKMDTSAAVTNGQFNSLNQTLACISASVNNLTNRLNSITQEIVPSSAICPEPMPRYNSFTAPTTLRPDSQTLDNAVVTTARGVY